MSVPPSRQAPGLVYEHLSIIDALTRCEPSG